MNSPLVKLACLAACLASTANAYGGLFGGGHGGGGVMGQLSSGASGAWHQTVNGGQHAAGVVSNIVRKPSSLTNGISNSSLGRNVANYAHAKGGSIANYAHTKGGSIANYAHTKGGSIANYAHTKGGSIANYAHTKGGNLANYAQAQGGKVASYAHQEGRSGSDPMHRFGAQLGHTNPVLKNMIAGPGVNENASIRDTYQGALSGAATGAAYGWAVGGPWGAAGGAIGGAEIGGVEGLGQGVFDTNKNLFESYDPSSPRYRLKGGYVPAEINRIRASYVGKPGVGLSNSGNTTLREVYQGGLKGLAAGGVAYGAFEGTGVNEMPELVTQSDAIDRGEFVKPLVGVAGNVATDAATSFFKNTYSNNQQWIDARKRPGASEIATARDAAEGAVFGPVGASIGAGKGVYDTNKPYFDNRITPGGTVVHVARGAAQGAAVGAVIGTPLSGGDAGAAAALYDGAKHNRGTQKLYAARSPELGQIVARSATALQRTSSSDPRRPVSSQR